MAWLGEVRMSSTQRVALELPASDLCDRSRLADMCPPRWQARVCTAVRKGLRLVNWPFVAALLVGMCSALIGLMLLRISGR